MDDILKAVQVKKVVRAQAVREYIAERVDVKTIDSVISKWWDIPDKVDTDIHKLQEKIKEKGYQVFEFNVSRLIYFYLHQDVVRRLAGKDLGKAKPISKKKSKPKDDPKPVSKKKSKPKKDDPKVKATFKSGSVMLEDGTIVLEDGTRFETEEITFGKAKPVSKKKSKPKTISFKGENTKTDFSKVTFDEDMQPPWKKETKGYVPSKKVSKPKTKSKSKPKKKSNLMKLIEDKSKRINLDDYVPEDESEEEPPAQVYKGNKGTIHIPITVPGERKPSEKKVPKTHPQEQQASDEELREWAREKFIFFRNAAEKIEKPISLGTMKTVIDDIYRCSGNKDVLKIDFKIPESLRKDVDRDAYDYAVLQLQRLARKVPRNFREYSTEVRKGALSGPRDEERVKHAFDKVTKLVNGNDEVAYEILTGKNFVGGDSVKKILRDDNAYLRALSVYVG